MLETLFNFIPIIGQSDLSSGPTNILDAAVNVDTSITLAAFAMAVILVGFLYYRDPGNKMVGKYDECDTINDEILKDTIKQIKTLKGLAFGLPVIILLIMGIVLFYEYADRTLDVSAQDIVELEAEIASLEIEVASLEEEKNYHAQLSFISIIVSQECKGVEDATGSLRTICRNATLIEGLLGGSLDDEFNPSGD